MRAPARSRAAYAPVVSPRPCQPATTMHPAVGRPQSLGEEIANSVSHGIGLLAALVGAPVLLLATLRYGTTANVVGAGVFVATTVLLYLASTLYHAFPHGAIFRLIAGTYTPFPRAAGGFALVVRGRVLVHGGRGVLRSGTAPLRPLRLAPVRTRRDRLPLLRRAVVRDLIRGGVFACNGCAFR